MSSGGGRVPYHLRPNKAVDRQLFLELLAKIDGYKKIIDYEYVGFGGPFLADFQLIHTTFGTRRMLSIEIEDDVYARQKFNRPVSCVKCKLQSSGDFVTAFTSQRPVIVWLDYASPGELRTQLNEYSALLSKLQAGDVLRITVNATPRTLEGQTTSSPVEVKQAQRLETLKDRLGDLIPNGTVAAQMTKEGYPELLAKIIAGLGDKRSSSDHQFLQLTSWCYSDGEHTMLTHGGIVMRRSDEHEFWKKTALRKWPFYTPAGQVPRRINLPVLSLRERLFIDSSLPRMKARSLQKKLKFKLAKREGDSIEMLRAYADFYRHYPTFGRVFS